MSVNLRGNPFFLNDSGVDWVDSTLQNMTVEEKIGQLFCLVGMGQNDEQFISSLKNRKVGGFMFRPELSEEVLRKHRLLQENSKVPLLLAANLEAGGNGIVAEGTDYAKPLQCAAAGGNLEEGGYRLGKVACAEGAAVGCNWSFAPIVDIDMNFRNPITNLRTFGDNPESVYKMAKGYMKAGKEENVAVCIKHFPGDGVDERDQHLLTSINSLSTKEWDETFGMVYGNLINDGAQSVMVGHIAQPAYARSLKAGISPEEANLPATLSPVILQELLRGKLGFNGVISTDASLMVGLSSAMTREKAVPYTIAAGCDIFLFTKSEDEDFEYMKQGVDNGVISKERLDEAVTRILALKASLNLHTKQKENTLVPSENKIPELTNKHREWTKENANNSITLVKNNENLLPLSPEKTKRIYLNVLEESKNINSPLRTKLKTNFEELGFEVTVRDRSLELDMEALMRGEMSPGVIALFQEGIQKVSDWKNEYDLVIYVANYETASNNTVIRLSWNGLGGAGNDYPWFVQEIPTVFISLANPYHLLDVPMMKTFINAYNSNNDTIDALFEKLMGKSEFTGVNPVDPFCGIESTSL